ncbi:MAG: ABC transporter substrate-binding protein [Chloroflexi bacterium]|nr:ABC transporter substrate-binding protein [Chloroflexota bacterium]
MFWHKTSGGNVRNAVQVVAALLITVLFVGACQQPAPVAPPAKQAAPTTAPAKQEAQPKATSPAPVATAPAAAQKPAAPKPQEPPEKPLSPPVNVKVGMLSPAGSSDAGTLIAVEKGYFKEEGINVEVVPFSNLGQMIAPLSTNQIEVGGGMLGAALFNATSRDIPLKIVADKGSVPKGFGYLAMVVRKDLVESGAFKSDADLKGRTFAYNTSGGITELSLEAVLAKANLTRKDINEQVIPSMPDILTALANKAVDAGFFIEPSVVQGVDRGIIVRWKGFDEIYPNQQIAVLVYSPKFGTAASAAAANRFMVAYLRGVRDYYDAFKSGKNKQEVISIMTKTTPLKDAALFERMVPVGLNPNGSVNAETITNDAKWLTEKGFVKQPIDAKTLIDSQYVDYAVKRLGKY